MARRPASLALRLTVSIGSVITVLLLAFGWLIERSIDRHFVQQDVDELNAVIESVSQLLSEPERAAGDEALQRHLASAVSGHHNVQIRLTDSDENLLYATPHSNLKRLAGLTPSADRIDIDSVHTWKDQGRTYRGAAVQLMQAKPVAQVPVTLVVATDIDFHVHYLDSLHLYLKLISLAACLIAILATWFAVYQGHAPLRRISAEIRRIKSDHLSIRLAPATVPVELTELAISFNDMLDRIEESFARLSNFCADIAHELRTPITNLRTQTEVALSQARDLEQYQEILYSSLEEYERMAKMVSDMLFLAQADNQQLQGERVKVNLLTEVQMLFEYFEAWADERGVALVCTGSALWVEGDQLMLRRALSNLLSNAIRYTAAGQAVTVALLAHSSDGVVIRVENPGLTIDPAHLAKLFDRFYRADPSRQRKGDGAGLGLAIVKSIIAAHGGHITANSAAEQMIFEIQLPRMPAK